MTHRNVGRGGAARAVRWTGGGLATVVLLVGCGASDDATTGEGGGTATSSSFVSPLQEYLDPSSAGDGIADYEAKEKQVQEIVAACMAEQGFDYVPFVYPMPSSPAMEDMDHTSRAWAEKYGYGFSTMNEVESSSAETVVDPNQAITEAMSEGEREAYYRALWGGGMDIAAESPAPTASTAEPAPAPATEAGGTSTADTADAPAESVPLSIPEESVAEMPPMSMADQGCFGKAQAEVYGDAEADQQEFQPMWDAYNNLFGQLENDDRIKAAEKAWADCMAGAGHPDLAKTWDAQQQANDRWSELNGWPTSDDGHAVQSMSMEPTTPAPDKVSEFRAYEIDLAVDDWDCKQSSGYSKVFDEVRIALEEQFLEEHRAELEQYRDAINGGG